MDPADRLREYLADAKARGLGFEWSWRTGRAAALAEFDGHPRVRNEWAAALAATRGTWERAYLDAPASAGERAVRELLHLLVDAERVDSRGTLVA